MSNIFYNYVYLDPRKPGDYNYGDLHFDFEPFLIGKGKHKRCYDHLNEKKENIYNSFKFNKIQKIKKEGLKPIILKIYENLEESEAFRNEIFLIKLIGRCNKRLGPLTNLTDGGEGMSGHKHTPESILKMSESAKNISDETRMKRSIAATGRKLSEETKIKVGIKSSQKIMSEESKEKLRKLNSGKNNKMYGKKHTLESILKMSESHKNISDETRYKMSESRKGKKCSDITKSKISKPVLQFTLDNIFIKEFKSQIFASKETGINQGSISNCCKNKTKYAGDFIWRFKQDTDYE